MNHIFSIYLKTVTGDTIVLNEKIYKSAIQKLEKSHVEADIKLLEAGLQIPPPVFFCSIEVNTQIEENRLKFALNCLQREDPTLKVIFDDEVSNSNQTIIQGMGELHLEIIKERIKKEYGLDVYFGPLEIAYKEAPTIEIKESLNIQRIINGKKNSVEIELVLIPKKDNIFNSVTVVRTPEQQFNDLNDEQLNAINHGIKSAFFAGG